MVGLDRPAQMSEGALHFSAAVGSHLWKCFKFRFKLLLGDCPFPGCTSYLFALRTCGTVKSAGCYPHKAVSWATQVFRTQGGSSGGRVGITAQRSRWPTSRAEFLGQGPLIGSFLPTFPPFPSFFQRGTHGMGERGASGGAGGES